MAEEYQPIAAAVKITSANNTIDFDEGLGPLSAIIPDGTYYFYGPSSALDPNDLSFAIEQAMTAAGTLNYDVACFFDVQGGNAPGNAAITTTGLPVPIQLLGTSTFDLRILGFPLTGSIAASLLTSTIGTSHSWVSNQIAAVIDDGPWTRETVEHVAPSGRSYHFSASDVFEFRNLEFAFVERERTFAGLVSGPTADMSYSFEELWRKLSSGLTFRVFQDSASGGLISGLTAAELVGTYSLTGESLKSFVPRRPIPGLPAYDWPLAMRAVV